MKMVYFDKSGFALWTKRLEESRFSWPRELEEKQVTMTAGDLEMLLSGVNIWTRFKKLQYRTVI